MYYIKFPKNKSRFGSALILAVILTALLAVIGTIFLLSSRVESMSTSSIEEEKALESAIDSIIKKIANELTNDVPGVSGQEYYDYPGEKDTWLASIEPYKNTATNEYIWPQITDLTGLLQNQKDDEMRFATRHVKVKPQLSNVIIEYPEIKLNDNGTWLRTGNKKDIINNKDDGLKEDEYRGQLADADGDGIADSKWIRLVDTFTGKGKDIYAAIRIIDNGGMINVNTAYRFDPTVTFNVANNKRVDGSTQSNIDLKELAYSGDSIDDLVKELNNDKNNVDAYIYNDAYINKILRRIESPDDPDYQPFDISDDLDLRSRFCVSSKNKGRLKTVWEDTLDIRNRTFDSSSGDGLSDWIEEICRETLVSDSKYDRRHMLTCWNMDRIINPDGISAGGSLEDCKMFGVNGRLDNMGNYDQTFYKDFDNRQKLFQAIRKALEDTMTLATSADISAKAAQIMVNLIDYIDEDFEMTVIDISTLDSTQASAMYYGFEGPCIYISEVAQKFKPGASPSDPNLESYAIELYNPYASDTEYMGSSTDKWYIEINGTIMDEITWDVTKKTVKYHVLYKEDELGMMSGIDAGASKQPYPMSFTKGSTISLVRKDSLTGEKIPVDSMTVPKASAWFQTDNVIHYIERDIKKHKCIKNIWGSDSGSAPTLGNDNIYEDTTATPIQAHPANKGLDCIGDIGNVFAVDVYGANKASMEEENVRIDLADPLYQNLFQYLTVFDPSNDNIDNDDDGMIDDNDKDGPEWKIPGRININTAPWFVLAQLPWVSKERGGAINYKLSKAIVAYRDKIKIDNADYSGDTNGRFSKIKNIAGMPTINQEDIREDVGFRSIGELNFVVDNIAPSDDFYSIWRYGLDGTDLTTYPDVLNQSDGAVDDFEERDIIFARISNLVTVRSDVFTAYILVRVGVDGPQQRAIAVLDRSDVYPNPDPKPNSPKYIGKVKIRAFQMMPDIR